MVVRVVGGVIQPAGILTSFKFGYMMGEISSGLLGGAFEADSDELSIADLSLCDLELIGPFIFS